MSRTRRNKRKNNKVVKITVAEFTIKYLLQILAFLTLCLISPNMVINRIDLWGKHQNEIK